MKFFRYLSIDDSQSRYFASWRGGSAILVLIGHSFAIFHSAPHPAWTVIATCAVLIFFGLSGFFIHKALAKSFVCNTPQPFLIGRVNRIIPPFAFSVLVTILLWIAAPWFFPNGDRNFVTPTARTEFSLDGLLPSIAFLNGFAGPTLSANGPLWSLSFEIWYYAAAFLLGVALLRRATWVAALTVMLLIGLSATNLRFAILGVIWLFGFGLSALHGMGKVPKIREAPMLAVAIVACLLAAFISFKGALLLANLAVGFWFVAHMAGVLNGKAPRTIGLLHRSSFFAYALYVLHFPLLLFIYGASGERSWVMIPATLGVLAITSLIGGPLERATLIRSHHTRTSHSAGPPS